MNDDPPALEPVDEVTCPGCGDECQGQWEESAQDGYTEHWLREHAMPEAVHQAEHERYGTWPCAWGGSAECPIVREPRP